MGGVSLVVLAPLADALVGLHLSEEALATIDEALQIGEALGDHHEDAELLCLKGDALLALPTPNTAAAVAASLGKAAADWVVCYQSRVGPLEWIGPSTDEEVRRAGRDGVPVLVAPIAFVSEHSETLVELDIEYRHVAEQAGVPAYMRAPTVDARGSFIDGLAGLVTAALQRPAARERGP